MSKLTAPVSFLVNDELYRTVVLDKLLHAHASVWIATANLKATMVEVDGAFVSILEVFARLAERGVALRILHADLPSRPFRAEFDRRRKLVQGGLALKICPRVHMKCVIVDGAWIYLGSANLTGAGLGAKAPDRRNFEVGIVTEDLDLLDRMTALFDAIWTGAECGACKLRDLCPDPIGKAAPSRRKARPTATRRPTRRGRSISGMWKDKPES